MLSNMILSGGINVLCNDQMVTSIPVWQQKNDWLNTDDWWTWTSYPSAQPCSSYPGLTTAMVHEVPGMPPSPSLPAAWHPVVAIPKARMSCYPENFRKAEFHAAQGKAECPCSCYTQTPLRHSRIVPHLLYSCYPLLKLQYHLQTTQNHN